MKILKAKRKTKRTHIKNKWSFGDWYENVTCIYLTFLGIKINVQVEILKQVRKYQFQQDEL